MNARQGCLKICGGWLAKGVPRADATAGRGKAEGSHSAPTPQPWDPPRRAAPAPAAARPPPAKAPTLWHGRELDLCQVLEAQLLAAGGAEGRGVGPLLGRLGLGGFGRHPERLGGGGRRFWRLRVGPPRPPKRGRGSAGEEAPGRNAGRAPLASRHGAPFETLDHAGPTSKRAPAQASCDTQPGNKWQGSERKGSPPTFRDLICSSVSLRLTTPLAPPARPSTSASPSAVIAEAMPRAVSSRMPMWFWRSNAMSAASASMAAFWTAWGRGPGRAERGGGRGEGVAGREGGRDGRWWGCSGGGRCGKAVRLQRTDKDAKQEACQPSALSRSTPAPPYLLRLCLLLCLPLCQLALERLLLLQEVLQDRLAAE